MNSIRQRLISLRNRARDVQNGLRCWGAYAGGLTGEARDKLLSRWTPDEREDFVTDLEQTSRRLKPVQVQIEIFNTWYDFVLETVEEHLDRARALLDQGRNHECLAILNDVEARLIAPNRDTAAYATRSFAQRVAPTTAYRMVVLDAVIRAMYLPTVRNVHQRGLVAKECLSRAPLAVLSGFEAETGVAWRQHAIASAAMGRFIPLALVTVPQQNLGDPWNLVGTAHEVGLQLYTDLDLASEMAHKLLAEAPAAGVSSETAPLWASWHETLFADVFGVLQLGPAYVSGMIETLTPSPLVSGTGGAPLPPAYIRWHVMLQTLQLLSYADEARERFNQIHLLCGDPNQLAQQFGPVWLTLVNEARTIAGALAFSPVRKLGGVRVIDVVPPLLSGEMEKCTRVKDLLLGGDESCTSDTEFNWAATARDVPAHLALAGLRLAFDAFPQQDVAARLRTRFWCLMQFLCRETLVAREREDRENAPGKDTLKFIAQRAAPAAVA